MITINNRCSGDDRSHVRMSEPVQKKLFDFAEPSKHQAPETCHFLDDSQNIKPGYSHELKCVNKGTIETVVGPSDSSTKESPNPQILPQEQSSDPSFHPSVICNVAGRPPSQSSDSSGTPTDSRHATGRHGGIVPGVRPETCGQKVPGHLGHRPGVDHLGHISLREEHKEGTSDFHDVCGEESGRTRETRWHSGENGHRSSADTSSSNIDQVQGDDAPSQDQRCFINSTPIPETEEEDFDLIESLASVEDHLPPTEHQADVATLQQRMLHMENALMQIMNHLQTQQ